MLLPHFMFCFTQQASPDNIRTHFDGHDKCTLKHAVQQEWADMKIAKSID